MSTIIEFPGKKADPVATRVVEPLSFEEFCLADAAGRYSMRNVVNGMTILNFDDAIMICGSNGECSVVRYHWANIEQHLFDALAAIA